MLFLTLSLIKFQTNRKGIKAGIIRRGFTSSMLGSREVFVIKDGWIVLKELFVDDD